MHIELALAGVPLADRCKCRDEPKAAPPQPVKPTRHS